MVNDHSDSERGYKGVRAVRPESVADGGWFEVLWNLECHIGLSQREICAHFQLAAMDCLYVSTP